MGQGNKFSGSPSLTTTGGLLSESKHTKEVVKGNPLLAELVNSGVKISPEKIIFAARDKSGQIVWLESGNQSAGLSHIVQRHAADFAAKHDIQPQKLASYLRDVIAKGRIVSSKLVALKNGKQGLEKIYVYKDKYYTMSAIGTNGYIVTMYPTKGGK